VIGRGYGYVFALVRMVLSATSADRAEGLVIAVIVVA
jgi:hypothetical protein